MLRTMTFNTKTLVTVTTLFLLSFQSSAQSFSSSASQTTSNETEVSRVLQDIQTSTSDTASPQDILFSIENADDNEIFVQPLFTASAELGFLYKTGNSQTGDMKAALDFRMNDGQWLSILNMDLLVKKSDVVDDDGNAHFQSTEEKWAIVSQTNYALSESDENYIYGNLSFENRSIGSYSSQNSVSTGWGRHWYRSNNASFWADIGPGYKSDILRETDLEEEREEDTWIVQAQALYLRKLGEFVEFKQFFSTKLALNRNYNSIFKAESSITTKLISTLQLRFSFTVDINTEVEPGKEHTDTQTAATLVYSF